MNGRTHSSTIDRSKLVQQPSAKWIRPTKIKKTDHKLEIWLPCPSTWAVTSMDVRCIFSRFFRPVGVSFTHCLWLLNQTSPARLHCIPFCFLACVYKSNFMYMKFTWPEKTTRHTIANYLIPIDMKWMSSCHLATTHSLNSRHIDEPSVIEKKKPCLSTSQDCSSVFKRVL